MKIVTAEKSIQDCLQTFSDCKVDPLAFVPQRLIEEKLISLMLQGLPPAPPEISPYLDKLTRLLRSLDTGDVNVVVFGGGTGLANVIGGDSRVSIWPRRPFKGLKEMFPRTRAVVCVTDDGGSTGELLKDVPVIALGDLRHVMLSAVRKKNLTEKYGLTENEAVDVVAVLYRLFNHRFDVCPESLPDLLHRCEVDLQHLPAALARRLRELLDGYFTDAKLRSLLNRPHCLGNLLLFAAIYRRNGSSALTRSFCADNAVAGISSLGEMIGAEPRAVLPCCVTPANLKILYTNGVLVTGEHKSGFAQRGYPVDRVFVEFVDKPQVPAEVIDTIGEADIILFAPGSLYTSIIPILQSPGIVEAIRRNEHALKVLVSNLWVQKGETDLVWDNPRRRFYVSDLIKAYHRNIPQGVDGLFHHVLVMGLHEVSGSILQNYAVEGKVPIYFDRGKVGSMGFRPIEARIFSEEALDSRDVVQHDPDSLAKTLLVIWGLRHQGEKDKAYRLPHHFSLDRPLISADNTTPDERFRRAAARIDEIAAQASVKENLRTIFWQHKDIPLDHLDLVDSVELIETSEWERCQEWDNIFSFYDPASGAIKIRKDIAADSFRFETAFLIALGESLLGNYAAAKNMRDIVTDGECLGKVYELLIRPAAEMRCYFNREELAAYLKLARMVPSGVNPSKFTRLVNGQEGFTPPGLLMGLTYAWYLDNRLAHHIEYKMAIKRVELSDLIPEQRKMLSRRMKLTGFFRNNVFRLQADIFEELPVGRE